MNKLLRFTLLTLVILIAILIRLSVAASDIPIQGDAKTRYNPIANNLLDGHGFSRDTSPAHRPDNFDQPGYPMMLAAVYFVSSRSPRAVVMFQLLLELLILLPVFVIMRELRLTRAAQILGLGFGLVSPFLAKYAGLLLSEVLATLMIYVSCFAFIRAVRESSDDVFRWWAIAGISSGLTLLIRADTVILIGLMLAVAIVLARPDSQKRRFQQIGIIGAALMITMAPWTFRNYYHFKTFKPLGNVAAQSGHAYVKWLNTWFDDPAELKTFWWEALSESAGPPQFPVDKISDQSERDRAANALMMARSQKTLAGLPTQAFQELAVEGREKRPFATYLLLPIKRLVKTWLTPHINKVPAVLGTRLPFYAVHTWWLLLSVLSVAGTVYAVRQKQYAVLFLVAIIVGRFVLPMISSLGADARLLVETLPAMYVLSAISALEIWGWTIGPPASRRHF